jgi:hypothetical protein
MLKAWAEVWFVLAEGRRTLGFLRGCGSSDAEDVSAMVYRAAHGGPGPRSAIPNLQQDRGPCWLLASRQGWR